MALIIIGKVLLTLLIIIVLLLFLLLFFPISYRLNMKRELQKTELKVHFRWLFGLLRGRFLYPQPKRLQLFVLWMELTKENPSQKKNKPGLYPEKNKSTKERNVSSDDSSAEGSSGSDNTTEYSAPDSEEHKSTKSPGFIGKMKDKANKTADTFKQIKDNVIKYTSILKEENTKVLLGDIFTEIKRFLKYLKPKKQSASLTVGTGSPDTTGYLYGLICMYSHVFGPDVFIYPDFENKIFEGKLEISGRITVFMLGIIVLRLYRNKNLPEFLDKFKKKEA